jgi:AdoMet-dependent heme synthase
MKATKRFFSNLEVVLRKACLFPRLVWNYFQLFTGKKPLRTVEIVVTYDCQCKCWHCSSEGLKEKEKELTISEMKSIINQAVRLGAIHILFTGGETLIPKAKLIEMIRYASKKCCIVSIDTNGILLDLAYAKELKNAGLDVACISLDSMDKVKHDKARDYPGCFEKSLSAIRNCKRHGIDVMISTLVTKRNLRDGGLLDVLDFAEKNKSSVIFCLPVPTGRMTGKKNECLDMKDMQMMDKVMRHPLARLCEENNYMFKGCAAGSEKISVTLYGDVMPCSFIKQKVGNIRSNTLTYILSKMRLHKEYSRVNRGKRCLAAGI